MKTVSPKLGRIYMHRNGMISRPSRILRTIPHMGGLEYMVDDEDLVYSESGLLLGQGYASPRPPGTTHALDLALEIPLEIGRQYKHPSGSVHTLIEYVNYIENVGLHIFIDAEGGHHLAFDNQLELIEEAGYDIGDIHTPMGKRTMAIVNDPIRNKGEIHKPGPTFLSVMVGGGANVRHSPDTNGVDTVVFNGIVPQMLEQLKEEALQKEQEEKASTSEIDQAVANISQWARDYGLSTRIQERMHESDPAISAVNGYAISFTLAHDPKSGTAKLKEGPATESGTSTEEKNETVEEPVFKEEKVEMKKPKHTAKKASVLGGAFLIGVGIGLFLLGNPPKDDTDPYQKPFL